MKRTIRFGLLLNPAERQTLARLAEIMGGVSQGAMVRNLIRNEARRRGLWPATDQGAQLQEEVHHD